MNKFYKKHKKTDTRNINRKRLGHAEIQEEEAAAHYILDWGCCRDSGRACSGLGRAPGDVGKKRKKLKTQKTQQKTNKKHRKRLETF